MSCEGRALEGGLGRSGDRPPDQWPATTQSYTVLVKVFVQGSVVRTHIGRLVDFSIPVCLPYLCYLQLQHGY